MSFQLRSANFSAFFSVLRFVLCVVPFVCLWVLGVWMRCSVLWRRCDLMCIHATKSFIFSLFYSRQLIHARCQMDVVERRSLCVSQCLRSVAILISRELSHCVNLSFCFGVIAICCPAHTHCRCRLHTHATHTCNKQLTNLVWAFHNRISGKFWSWCLYALNSPSGIQMAPASP